ncbi:hypothetical protein [Hanstruepera ponticola]|uniref:hypothetical protein n=1 Tax=Hanstruepera ponticola TaxID=2042995 RepID=UPI00178070FF|nr:hypothetical protein [Hanstruepera ponticola]
MKPQYFRGLILVLILVSCQSSYLESIKKTGTKDDARINAIKYFSNTNKLVSNKFYIVYSCDEAEELYCFKFYKNEKSLLKLTDSIGGYPTGYFPNKYIEIDNNLFLWHEPEAKITKEIIDFMNKYNAIDSSHYKIPDYLPIINTGDFKKEMHYFICKDNISIYEKRKSIYIDVQDYPKTNCYSD